MSKSLFLPLLAGVLLSPTQASPPSPIEVPLQFARASTGRTPGRPVFIPSGLRFLEKFPQPPGGNWKLPAFHARNPLYSILVLAGRKHLLVLDKKSPKSPFYDRLYFDADGDGDLTREPPVDARPSPGRSPVLFANFPPIQTRLYLPGGEAPYVFRVVAYTRLTPSRRGKKLTPKERLRRTVFYMIPRCGYAGTFELDGRTYRIVLADSNGDGRFGSPEKVSTGFGRKKPDQIYITMGKNLSYRDGMEVQGFLGLGSRLFRLAFHQAQKKLVLYPIEGSAALLELPMKVEKLVLLSAEKGPGITWFSPPGELRLPPGAYRLGSYQANRKDDGGNEWILRAGATKSSPRLALEAGEKGKLPFGEPYLPEVTVRARFAKTPKGKAVTAGLSFTLLGAGGEKVTDIRSSTFRDSSVPRSPRSKYRPLEPTYKILELPSLQVAAQGSFHYG